MSPELLLQVSDLTVRIDTAEGVVHATNGVSFDQREGETLAIVGESGSGKTTVMLSLIRLLRTPPGRIQSGKALFLGRDLLQLTSDEIRQVRGKEIGMIFQDPMNSLNPVLTVGRQLTEPLEEHLGLGALGAKRRAIELLQMVGIPDAPARLNYYPHQFSGGMQQRVMIAVALSCMPKLLIADEPTTALDVTIQAQILKLVKRIRQELGMAMIWITHDLGVVAGLADRVLVMYAGFFVEEASVDELFDGPQHPYTRGLLRSLPRWDFDLERLANIPGMPPDLLGEPRGCPFAARCPYVFDRCRDENPGLLRLGPSHRVACWWDIDKGIAREL
ncbi:MAG: ABC transporter ATP-binding protein [Anaerolineales bacterium]